MVLTQILLAELQREAQNTRKMLERTPEDQFKWQPHAKSMSLISLASHIAEIPGLFVTQTLKSNEMNFATSKYKRPVFDTSVELLQFYDETLQNAVATLQEASDEDLALTWTMRNGEHIILSLPKRAVIRSLCLNHVVHHRGQLSVYLRLLDVPVPGMYGPSADDRF